MSTEMIVQIITLSLIILAPLMLWGTYPTKWATVGCLMYAASYFIANSWQIAFLLLDPLPPEVAEASRQIMETAPPSAYGFALRIDQSNKRLLVAIYAFTVFFALRQDMQARFVWLVVAIAESFSFMEHAQCKLLVDPFGSKDLHLSTIWGIEVSRYACGRALGYLSPYAAPIITSAYLIWVNARKRRV